MSMLKLKKVRFLFQKKVHASYNPKLHWIRENRQLQQLGTKEEEEGYVKNPNQIQACTLNFCKGSGLESWDTRGKPPLFSTNTSLISLERVVQIHDSKGIKRVQYFKMAFHKYGA